MPTSPFDALKTSVMTEEQKSRTAVEKQRPAVQPQRPEVPPMKLFDGDISMDDLVEAIGHKNFVEVPLTGSVQQVLEQIHQLLNDMILFRINNNSTQLTDFNVSTVVFIPAATPFAFASEGPHIVFQHRRTKEVSIHIAFPKAGTHWATASHLIAMNSR